MFRHLPLRTREAHTVLTPCCSDTYHSEPEKVTQSWHPVVQTLTTQNLRSWHSLVTLLFRHLPLRVWEADTVLAACCSDTYHSESKKLTQSWYPVVQTLNTHSLRSSHSPVTLLLRHLPLRAWEVHTVLAPCCSDTYHSESEKLTQSWHPVVQTLTTQSLRSWHSLDTLLFRHLPLRAQEADTVLAPCCSDTYHSEPKKLTQSCYSVVQTLTTQSLRSWHSLGTLLFRHSTLTAWEAHTVLLLCCSDTYHSEPEKLTQSWHPVVQTLTTQNPRSSHSLVTLLFRHLPLRVWEADTVLLLCCSDTYHSEHEKVTQSWHPVVQTLTTQSLRSWHSLDTLLFRHLPLRAQEAHTVLAPCCSHTYHSEPEKLTQSCYSVVQTLTTQSLRSWHSLGTLLFRHSTLTAWEADTVLLLCCSDTYHSEPEKFTQSWHPVVQTLTTQNPRSSHSLVTLLFRHLPLRVWEADTVLAACCSDTYHSEHEKLT